MTALLSLLILWIPAALAQENQAQGGAKTANESAPSAEQAKGDAVPTDKLEENVTVYGEDRKIVSATRTDMKLLDIPMAVQVVDEAVIQQQQIIDLREVFRNVSGIQNTAAWGNGSAALGISARGFDLADTNFRRNGLYMVNVGNHYSPVIAEVQVLKGPSSVLYGDVSPGGVINLVTKKPKNAEFTNLELTTGEEGLARPTIDINGRVNQNENLLYRVVAAYEESDSYRDEVRNRYSLLAPSFTWRMSAQSELTLEAYYRDDVSTEDVGIVPIDGTLAEVESIPVSRFYGHPIAGNEYEDTSFAASFTHYLSESWHVRLTGQTQHNPRLNRGLWQSSFIDEDTISYGNSATLDKYNNHTAVVEVLGSFETGSVSHRLLLGGDYTNATTRTAYERFPNSVGSYNNPEYDSMPNILDLSNDFNNYRTRERRWGINLQNNMSLMGDRLHILMGLRINDYYRNNQYDDPADEPAANLSSEDSPTNPRLGVVFKPAEHMSLYASYGESFEVNGRHRYNPNRFLDPTLGEQFEVGLKGNFFDDRLGTTVSLFSLEKQNHPSYIDVSVADEFGIPYDPDEVSIDGDVLYISKAQRARGLELDWNGKLGENLYLIGSGTLMETEILDDIIYEEGNQLENAPESSASLWAQYQWNDNLYFGAGAFYQGSYYGDKENTEDTKSPAHTKFDVNLGYRFDRYHVQLNVKNLTDEQTYLNKWGYWNPQWPRRVLLQVGMRL